MICGADCVWVLEKEFRGKGHKHLQHKWCNLHLLMIFFLLSCTRIWALSNLIISFDANAWWTDWFAFHCIKWFTANWFFTIPANKAVGVPLSIQCWNIVFHDGTVASAAFWCEHIKIVVATIWFTITFMEAIFAELLSTLRTEEMFCVPCLV